MSLWKKIRDAAASRKSASFRKAVQEGDLSAVKRQLRRYPDLVFDETWSGTTPLHDVASKDVAELLLAHGAEVNAKNYERKTPLHIAVGLGRKDVVEILLASHAEVNAKDEFGWTPLHDAVQGNNRDEAELLLIYHAEVEATTHDGRTPLHIAAECNRKELAELLLTKHADLNTTDASGETALDVAAGHGHKDIIKLLQAGGAGHGAKHEELALAAQLRRRGGGQKSPRLKTTAKDRILEHIAGGGMTSILRFGSRVELFRVFLKFDAAYAGYIEGTGGLYMVAGLHDGSFRDFMVVEAYTQAGYSKYDELHATGEIDEIERSVLSEQEIRLKRGGVGSLANHASPGMALTSLEEFDCCVAKLRSEGYVTVEPADEEPGKWV